MSANVRMNFKLLGMFKPQDVRTAAVIIQSMNETQALETIDETEGYLSFLMPRIGMDLGILDRAKDLSDAQKLSFYKDIITTIERNTLKDIFDMPSQQLQNVAHTFSFPFTEMSPIYEAIFEAMAVLPEDMLPQYLDRLEAIDESNVGDMNDLLKVFLSPNIIPIELQQQIMSGKKIQLEGLAPGVAQRLRQLEDPFAGQGERLINPTGKGKQPIAQEAAGAAPAIVQRPSSVSSARASGIPSVSFESTRLDPSSTFSGEPSSVFHSFSGQPSSVSFPSSNQMGSTLLSSSVMNPPTTLSSDPFSAAAEGPRSAMPVNGVYVPPSSTPSMSFEGVSNTELNYASNTIGDGNQNIPLGTPLERARYVDTQYNAIDQFNNNNMARARQLQEHLVPLPQYPGQVSFEEMQGIQQKREYAQLQLHIEQEKRDKMYMRMNQMQEQARNKGWMDYHYNKELA